MFIYEGTNNLVSGAFLKCFGIEMYNEITNSFLLRHLYCSVEIHISRSTSALPLTGSANSTDIDFCITPVI